MSFVAVAVVGSAVVGAYASKRAGQQQKNATNQAVSVQQNASDQARSDLQPFAQAGGGVLNPLTQLALTPTDVSLERAQGFQDIQNSAAAGGKLRSGGTLKALTAYNSMLNAKQRNDQFNQLFNLATLGSNAAAGQATNTLGSAANEGNLITQGGNAQAASTVGQANSVQNALSNYIFLNAIKKPSASPNGSGVVWNQNSPLSGY